MADIARYCRIFDQTPSDDLVTKRTQGIEALRKAWLKKTDVEGLVRLASGVADALQDPNALPASLATEAVTPLKKFSPALIYQGHELEIAVCSAVALLAWLESSSPSDDVPMSKTGCIASALWCALAVQTPSSNLKLEELRRQVLSQAQEWVLNCGILTRRRKTIPDFEMPLQEGEVPDAPKLLEKVEIAADATISALRENAIRDREELDLLWWALSDFSETLSRPLSALPPVLRAITGALEISKIMRRLPTESHKQLVIRQIEDTEAMSFEAILADLGEDRAKLAGIHSGSKIVSDLPRVFPLLSAIATNDRKVDSSINLPLSIWTKHVLLEACVATMVVQVSPGI